MDYKYILYEKEDGIATITLNRPEKLNSLIPPMRVEMRGAFEDVAADTLKATSEVADASSLLTSSSNLCFVMMSYRPPDAVYRKLIRPVVEQFGLKVLRADEIYSPGSIPEQIRAAIQQARLCIADVSDRNPNVLYEVGIAHTLGKPTILLTMDTKDIPFDLRTIRFIIYKL